MRQNHVVWLLMVLVFASALASHVAFGGVDVLTQHNDNQRTGANLQETELKPSVLKNHLHKLVYRIVDGNLYAQPLIATGVKVANHPNPVDVAIVATEHNSVYAFDANDTNQTSTTATLWHVDEGVLGQHLESAAFYADLGAPKCNDTTTEIGITSTPVIKLTGTAAARDGVVFVAAKSRQGNGYAYKLFGLNLGDGTKIGELAIAGQVNGTGPGSTGTGAGAVLKFDPKVELNRPALLLVGNTLYVAFGGHCDAGEYHGWVFAVDVEHPEAMKTSAVFCDTPNGKGNERESRGGIWMSGQGPAADESGNVYFVSGDGTYNGTTDFGDSVVRLKTAGADLTADDWFTPQNQEELKVDDVDLGSCGAVLVPQSHLLICGGKEGRMYLLDRDHMGKGTATSLHSFQVTHNPDLRFEPKMFYNIHGAPVIWPRGTEMNIYVMGEEDPLKQFTLVADPTNGWRFASDNATKTSKESAPYPNSPAGQFGQAHRDRIWMPGGFCSISANGSNEGIIWVTMPFAGNANAGVVRGVLRAFDASDVSAGELWDSETTGNDNDRLGQHAKFCPPTVANGKVYVPTFQQETVLHDGSHVKAAGGDKPALVIYGLR